MSWSSDVCYVSIMAAVIYGCAFVIDDITGTEGSGRSYQAAEWSEPCRKICLPFGIERWDITDCCKGFLCLLVFPYYFTILFLRCQHLWWMLLARDWSQHFIRFTEEHPGRNKRPTLTQADHTRLIWLVPLYAFYCIDIDLIDWSRQHQRIRKKVSVVKDDLKTAVSRYNLLISDTPVNTGDIEMETFTCRSETERSATGQL